VRVRVQLLCCEGDCEGDCEDEEERFWGAMTDSMVGEGKLRETGGMRDERLE
jgi:hypothetical protein